MSARQQLSAPAGESRPVVEHRDLILPAVERRVQGRQVRDLQGDRDEPGQRGDVEDGLLRSALGKVRADLPDTGARQLEGVGDAAVHQRPEDEGEADEEHSEPGENLAEQ